MPASSSCLAAAAEEADLFPVLHRTTLRLDQVRSERARHERQRALSRADRVSDWQVALHDLACGTSVECTARAATRSGGARI
jgi:hypothetical protein